MKNILVLPFLLFCLTIKSQNCSDAQTLTSIQTNQINSILIELDSALKQENHIQIDSLANELKIAFGSEGGKPETIELYDTLSSNINWLNFPNSIQLSRLLIDHDSSVYSQLWKISKGMSPPNYYPNSIFLRASAETASGLLKIAYFETDISRKNLYESWAIRALDSLATMQLPNGAFPFPDLRDYGDPVFSSVIQNFLNYCGPDSVNVLQNGWIIDDKNTGEFKFDAGIIANAYYEAYTYTGDTNYRNIAIKVSDYSEDLKYNLNFNYNSFCTISLTRGYQINNNNIYLERALSNIRWGLQPGQLENGRWVDGHNANSRYHSVILQNISPIIPLIPNNHIYYNSIDTLFISAVRNLIVYTEQCGASTGYRWLLKAYPNINDLNLKDSVKNLIGKYIQTSAIEGDFLDIPTMGEYLELLNNTNEINETEFENKTIFPNPAKNSFQLTQNTPVQYWAITNQLGQFIMVGNELPKYGIFEISNLKTGLYFLFIKNLEGAFHIPFIKTDE